MTATCDTCGKRIKAGTWTVVVNVADQPTRRYHGACFVALEAAAVAGQDRKERAAA